MGQADCLIQIDVFPMNERRQPTRWDYARSRQGSLTTFLFPQPWAEYSISLFLLKCWRLSTSVNGRGWGWTTADSVRGQRTVGNGCLFLSACKSVGVWKGGVDWAIFALGDLKRRPLKCCGSGSSTAVMGGDEWLAVILKRFSSSLPLIRKLIFNN